MQIQVILIAALGSVAFAQTSTSSGVSSGPTCAAQVTLDACIGLEQGQINACSQNDWDYLCNGYTNLLTCYADCPTDTNISTVQQQHEQYCNAAAVYGSTSTHATATSTAASSATAPASGSSTSSSRTALQTGSASVMAPSTSASVSATHAANAASGLKYVNGLAAAIVACLRLAF